MAEVLLEAEARAGVSRPGPARPRRRWPVVIAVAALVVGGAGAWGLSQQATGARPTGPAVPGVVTGLVPLCFGPGPDMNLTPTLLVVASQQGRAAATVRVPATPQAHTYRLTLPPGTYAVRAGSWPSRQVTVPAGATTVVDLPGGGCL